MKIRFSFDDATLGDIQVVELLTKYGFEKNTIMYWPVMPQVCNAPKGRPSLSDSQMQEIAKAIEIGSHTLTHRLLTRILMNEARREIVESRKILQEKFNQEILSLCWPRGYTSPQLMGIAQEAGYKEARGVTVGYIHSPENKYDLKTTAHIGYDRKEYAGKTWFEYTRYMIVEAKKTPNSIIHLWGHSHELLAYPQGLQLFEDILEELKESKDAE